MKFTPEDIRRLVPEISDWVGDDEKKVLLGMLCQSRVCLEVAVEALEQATRTNQNGTPWFTKYQTINICTDALDKLRSME